MQKDYSKDSTTKKKKSINLATTTFVNEVIAKFAKKKKHDSCMKKEYFKEIVAKIRKL
jgi:hypothetical protein